MFRAMKSPAAVQQLGKRFSTDAPKANTGNLSTFMESVNANAHGLTVLGAAMAAAIGTTGYVVSLQKQIEMSKKEIEVLEAKTKAEVESARKETAEKFLMYGYAEEFQRYQAAVKKKSEE